MKIFIVLFFLSTMNLHSQKFELDKTLDGTSYRIKYDSKWKLDESGRNKTEFYLFYSPTIGKFGNNINLMIQNLEGMNLNLDSFTELSKNQIEANGKLIDSKRKSKRDLEFQELVFEAPYGSFEIKCFQYYFIKGSKAYILTFTALKDDYDSLLLEARSIMDSFDPH